MWDHELKERLAEKRVIAVLVIDDVADAVPLAQSLLDGGVTAIELTLRTAVALDALYAIRNEVPDMMAGVGTILRGDQLAAVKEAGAAFGVSPGFNPTIVKLASKIDFPFAPGIAIPGELEQAVELGCTVLKLFPAVPMGGLAYFKSMRGPYAHLGLSFIPLGGIDPSNMSDWLGTPGITAVGGSWIARRELIADRNWSAITENAHEAMRLAKNGGEVR